jgi:adenylate cyclase
MVGDAIRVRRALRRFLRTRGASPSEIENAERGRYLALLVLDREILPGARRYTMSELARRGGTDLATARGVWRALGFPDFPDDLPAFTDSDVSALRSFVQTFSQPIAIDWSIDVALNQARVVSSALARVADAVTDDIARSFRVAAAEGLSDEDLAQLLAERVDFEAIQQLVGHAFRVQLRAAVWRRLAGAEPEAPGTVRGAVGFVDLVGYTALAEELDDDELARLLSRFGELAHDTVVAGGGRIVKTIGDEVMFVTDTEHAAAGIAVQLTERSTGDDVLPATRAGIAGGHLVAREGDYFGPVVNLAARLTELARPGTVLAPLALGARLEGEGAFAVRRVPARRIRDIGRVEVCAIQAA